MSNSQVQINVGKVTQEAIHVKLEESEILAHWRLVLWIDFSCTLESSDSTSHLVAWMRIKRASNAHSLHGANDCHKFAAQCNDGDWEVNILLDDHLMPSETYLVDILLEEYDGTISHYGASDELHVVHNMSSTPVSIQNIQSEFKPVGLSSCMRYFEPSGKTKEEQQKVGQIEPGTDVKPNILNIALTLMGFMLFLFVVASVFIHNAIRNDMGQTLQVRFSLRRKRKSPSIKRRKSSEGMFVNDEDEDYAVLITTKSTSRQSSTAPQQLLLTDSDTDIYHAH